MFFGASASFGTSAVKRDLEEIDHAIQERLDTHKREEFEKHIAMYNITRDFIKRKGLIIYGGLAINMSMPKEKRFYDEYDLPDYDFLSYDPRTHATELADAYHEAGYKYVEVKPGIHYETYKVFVDFHGVADITGVPLRLFNHLHELAMHERPEVLKNNPSLDINIVPLDFLRMSFHLELSRPDGYIERWPKVYKRMALFYNSYPLNFAKEECAGIIHTDPEPRAQEAAGIALTYLKNNNIPVLGLAAMKVYLRQNGTKVPEGGILDEAMPIVEAVSMDFKATANAIYAAIQSQFQTPTMRLHSALNKNEMIPEHYIIYLYDRPIVCIYSSQACYAVKSIDGFSVLTIDAMLSMWYASMFASRSYYNIDRLRCAINILLNVQLKHLSSKKYVWRRFDLQCYGEQPVLEDVKKRRWNHKGFTYRP